MTSQTSDLNDRIILITGAGDGIGRTTALHCARNGATVLLLGRTTEKLESIYDDIMAEGLAEPGIIPMDLETVSEPDVKNLAEVIEANYGRLDALLHNAAILGGRIPFEHYEMTEWQKVMQINTHAVILLSRFLLPLLQRSSHGRLIFTSSTVGTTPRAYWGAYAVSKYAVEGLAKLLADELENTSNVRVNIINPGGTRTAMRAAAYPAEDPGSLKTADELMPLYLYLLGAASQHEHGQTFTADWLTQDSPATH